MFRIHGSHAAVGRLNRKPKDIDVICTPEYLEAFTNWIGSTYETAVVHAVPSTDRHTSVHFANGLIIDAELAYPGDSGHDLLLIEETLSPGATTVSLEALYALKMSHRYLKNSKSFCKTMTDIRALRKILGTSKIAKEYVDWFKKREEETYTYSHPKLNVKSKQFFSGDNVIYIYDHDSIHRAVAYEPNTPAYTKFQIDEVKVSRKLFDELSYNIRMYAVIEESMVLAIERSLVPYPGKKTPEQAYLMALEKVCTSITSGWFREFAWENYEIASEYAKFADYMFAKFQEALNRGEILQYKGDRN